MAFTCSRIRFQEPVGHFISHIKADAVDIIIPDPALANVLKVVDDRLAVRIELSASCPQRQRSSTVRPSYLPPYSSLPVVDHEPVRVGESFPFFFTSSHGAKVCSTMVEHCVHHHPDSVFVRLFYQMSHRLGSPRTADRFLYNPSCRTYGWNLPP